MHTASAAAFNTQPYLQNGTPNSIWVLWHTDTGIQSLVEYGTSQAALNSSANGSSSGWNNSQVHETQLTGLNADTVYFYRVTTDNAVGSIYQFRTPPQASAEKSFRFAVISDSQTQSSRPLKQVEIINDGIIDYITQNHGPDIFDNLAFLMHAGDLVANGGNENQFITAHFDDEQNLIRQVPLYPVPGNHELAGGEVQNYISVHNLPTNGSAGELEQWYYVDYSNIRIIGLDTAVNSNRNATQLSWLENTLDAVCQSSTIDFAFAAFHHPFKSELWTPGELNYAGDLIDKLEGFSTNCGKASAHFFGHTHGYSRGQSRDVPHLWINAATAEGAIDYWGAFPNADYPEFQYSEPKYGFMIVDVVAGNNPAFTIRRISRGNDVAGENNTQTDIITVRANNTSPAQPSPESPADGSIDVQGPDILLDASAFSDNDSDTLLESHWQLSTVSNDFAAPVEEKWQRIENWYSPDGATGESDGYFSVNTVTDSDITKVTVLGLSAGQTYYWRVRYRDSGLQWSDWSAQAGFTLDSNVPAGSNILTNAGAEQGTTGWSTVSGGAIESLANGECGSVSPRTGSNNFSVGGVCSGEQAFGEALQTVDISSSATDVDAGSVTASYAGYLRNFSGQDIPEIWVVFKDANSSTLDTTAKLSTTADAWTSVSATVDVPANTRNIEFHLSGTRNGGTDNDSYFDDLFLSISSGGTVTNLAPVVNAGADQSIDLSATATLNATVNDDGLPTPINLTTVWSAESGPGTVTFTDSSAVDTTATFSVAGTYVLRLTADDSALSASDDVQITVNDGSTTLPTGNLLINPGAEDNTNNWSTVSGTFESLLNGECASVSPQVGSRNFALGGVCSNEGPTGEAVQSVDVSTSDTEIDTGNVNATYSGYMRSFNGNDVPELWISFKDSADNLLSTATTLSSNSGSWVNQSATVNVPVNTRSIEFHLKGTRNNGTDNDSYFDTLSLTLSN